MNDPDLVLILGCLTVLSIALVWSVVWWFLL